MSINNLNNVHLTDEQITAVNEALTQLEQALQLINVNLTAEDRNRYGRVNEQNKLFINKVNDFAHSQPELRSPDVDWVEFVKDFKSRNFLENTFNRLQEMATRVNNAKILHDYDNYQDSLEDYAYTNFRAGSKKVGYEVKYKELKQFFTKSRKKDPSKDLSDTADTP
ncbi:hypothetical protein [Capnocytophaga canimorsus]|uniref:hypothetical protein n=1 Tax=Capnocytophaga canimorsus TaxID=28188 RepID=UPI001AD17673|nr:hypothetical protein [Capnocytophaga canimorsus]GIM58954.1 hypothetical protein CAPN007_11620 [Capnocytophaga canimorsus]